jgi:CheY-like chemotaxis protein
MSKRILVVEDRPDNRQIIRDMLAPTDYEITEVESGEEALKRCSITSCLSRPISAQAGGTSSARSIRAE